MSEQTEKKEVSLQEVNNFLLKIVHRYPNRNVWFSRFDSDYKRWNLKTPQIYVYNIYGDYYVVALQRAESIERWIPHFEMVKITLVIHRDLTKNHALEKSFKETYPDRHIFYQQVRYSGIDYNKNVRGLHQVLIRNNFYLIAVEQFYQFDLEAIFPHLIDYTYMKVNKPSDFEVYRL